MATEGVPRETEFRTGKLIPDPIAVQTLQGSSTGLLTERLARVAVPALDRGIAAVVLRRVPGRLVVLMASESPARTRLNREQRL